MNRGYGYGGYGGHRYGYSMPKSTPLPQKFPQDIQCVYPSSDPNKGAIYVSNVEAASNHQTLAKHNIKAVMTCAKGHHTNIPRSRLEMFEYFPFDDHESCQISPYFEKACDFIADAVQKTNVLVHCIAGVSRSVSMVLAYLIRDKGMGYDEAYRTVKSRRNIISPNDGFIKQLKQYAQKIRTQMMTKSAAKTPQKSRIQQQQPIKKSFTASEHNTEKYNQNYDLRNNVAFKFASRNPQSILKSNENRNIDNQQDGCVSPKMMTSQKRWNQNLNKNSSMFNQTTIKKMEQPNDRYELKNIRNNSMMLNKTSPLIADDRPTTPKKIMESKIDDLALTKQNRGNYFKKMNDELNTKIEAIHAKYQKQREALLAKRGYTYTDKHEPQNNQTVTASPSKPDYKDQYGHSYRYSSSDKKQTPSYSYTYTRQSSHHINNNYNNMYKSILNVGKDRAVGTQKLLEMYQNRLNMNINKTTGLNSTYNRKDYNYSYNYGGYNRKYQNYI